MNQTSRSYKTPFYFYYCVPSKIPRGILFQILVEHSPSSRLLVSAHCSLRHRVRDYVSLIVATALLRVSASHFDLAHDWRSNPSYCPEAMVSATTGDFNSSSEPSFHADAAGCFFLLGALVLSLASRPAVFASCFESRVFIANS